MVSKNLCDHVYFVHFLTDAPKKQFSAVVKLVSKDQAKVIKEIVVNLVKGNIDLSPSQIKSLSKVKKFLRKVASSPSGVPQHYSAGNVDRLHYTFRIIGKALREITAK